MIKKFNEMKKITYSNLQNWNYEDIIDSKKYKNKQLNLKHIDDILLLFDEYNLKIEIRTSHFCKRNKIILPDEKQYKEYRILLDIDDNFNYNISWSVFLPIITNNNELLLNAIADSSEYLKILYKSFPNIINGVLFDYNDPFFYNINNIKKFLNLKNINITNNNIELIVNINNRIYKDSKVFYNFNELFLNEYNIQSKIFFDKWYNIIKNS